MMAVSCSAHDEEALLWERNEDDRPLYYPHLVDGVLQMRLSGWTTNTIVAMWRHTNRGGSSGGNSSSPSAHARGGAAQHHYGDMGQEMEDSVNRTPALGSDLPPLQLGRRPPAQRHTTAASAAKRTAGQRRRSAAVERAAAAAAEAEAEPTAPPGVLTLPPAATGRLRPRDIARLMHCDEVLDEEDAHDQTRPAGCWEVSSSAASSPPPLPVLCGAYLPT
jgi:hypothetical protein